MAEEIQEAVQIIRVAYDGIEIAMKIGSGTLSQVKKSFDLIVALLDREKLAGKADMRKLLLKGGDLQVLQFATEDLKQVEKLAKKYGILYSVLPDINKKDGMSEILFHTEAVPRVNMMLQKIKTGRIGTLDDYLKNGDEKELDKVFSILKGHKKGNGNLHTETLSEQEKADGLSNGLLERAGLYAVEKADTSVEEISEKFNITTGQAGEVLERLEDSGVLKRMEEGRYQPVIDKNKFMERISRYREISERVQAASQAQNKNFLDISISKQLIAEENDHAVKTRIPGTWGENARYLWIEKEKISEIHSGKSIFASLDSNKEYKLYSTDNRVAGTMNGGQLYENHYDRVEAEVRKRHAEAKKKAEERKRFAAAEKKAAEVTGKMSASAGRHLP